MTVAHVRNARKIAAFRNTVTKQTTRVFRDSEFGEFIVKLYGADGVRVSGADYFTDNRIDAYGTARAMLGASISAIEEVQ